MLDRAQRAWGFTVMTARRASDAAWSEAVECVLPTVIAPSTPADTARLRRVLWLERFRRDVPVRGAAASTGLTREQMIGHTGRAAVAWTPHSARSGAK